MKKRKSGELRKALNAAGMSVNEHSDKFYMPQNEEQRTQAVRDFFQLLDEINQQRALGNRFCPGCQAFHPEPMHDANHDDDDLEEA